MKVIVRSSSVRLEPGVEPGEAIAAAVREVGVREVARRAGCSATTVSRFIAGDCTISLDTAKRICAAAKVGGIVETVAEAHP